MTTFKANRKFPNPITVTDDPKSHTLALQQIIEALNIGQRRTKEIQSSYVRVHELVDVGLIEVVGSQLKLTNAGAAAVAAGASALADLTDVNLTGLADGDTLIWDSASSTWVPVAGGTGTFVPSDLYDASLSDLADVGVYMPSDGDCLVWNASLGVWEAGAAPPTSAPYYVAEFNDDFLYHSSAAWVVNSSTWRSLASSSNTVAQLASVAGHPGIIRATNANTLSGAYTIYCATNDQNSASWDQWSIGASTLIFETMFRVSLLPTSANNFTVRMGLQDVNNATACLNLFIQWNGSAAEWLAYTGMSSVYTNTPTTTPTLTANTWYKFKVVATSTSVLYYINDTLIATHTTNIPTSMMTPYLTTARSAAGTTSFTFDVDYVYVRQEWASGRPA